MSITETIFLISYLIFSYWYALIKFMSGYKDAGKYPIVKMFLDKLFGLLLKDAISRIGWSTFIVLFVPISVPIFILLNIKDFVIKPFKKKKGIDLKKMRTPFIEAYVSEPFPRKK